MANVYKKIKPLVIGLGLAGNRHLKAQLDLGIKTGVYNINLETANHLKKQANVIVFDNLRDAISWSNLVHVCTPDNTHGVYIALALKNKKAVLSEKPLTTNLQEALSLQDLSHKYNSPLIVGHNYRLTPTFLETKKRVSEGTLGTITTIQTTYLHDMTEYRMGTKWRNMQDFLYVGGSHAVDLACWIMNEKVVSVIAAAGNKVRPDYDSQERYQIILKFESGALGHIALDASSARLAHGSDLIIDAENGQLANHIKSNKLIFYKKGEKKLEFIKLPNTQTRTTALEVKIINDYLSGKSTSHWPLPGIDEALYTIKILDVIQKAVLSGKSEFVK